MCTRVGQQDALLSLGWSLWLCSITGCLVIGGAQIFLLHSSAEMAAESPQPVALG